MTDLENSLAAMTEAYNERGQRLLNVTKRLDEALDRPALTKEDLGKILFLYDLSKWWFKVLFMFFGTNDEEKLKRIYEEKAEELLASIGCA
jgi:hypothetical protein